MSLSGRFAVVVRCAVVSAVVTACGGGGGLRVDSGTGAADACPAADCPAEWGTTYYVRTDGGDATQCTGLADAPYAGAGTAQPCAWRHPFIALPPGGASAPRIGGGDRLIIGPGAYRMGVGAPGAESCDAGGAFDCAAAAIPSGPDAAHPTRIVGAGWDQGCAAPPELWGAERVSWLLSLRGTSDARVECLELTDHAACVDFHTGGLACERDTPPYGDWGEIGLVAADSARVTLRHLDIHGLAHGGVLAGRLADWTVEDVRLATNGWVGWDGDIEGDDSNTGTMRFTRWTVEWNGCVETYPGGAPTGCWAQTAGGYGDGVGTGETAGDWIIEDSAFRWNTSDGLDLLYHRLGGTITIERSRAEGNAGNQLKTSGDAVMRNSVVVGTCGFFDGKPFTWNVDDCRAAGNALSLDLLTSAAVSLVNNTIYSEGDCLVLAEAGCSGGTLTSRNNIYLGGVDFLAPGERSCLLYNECTPTLAIDRDYDQVFATKDATDCPAGAHDLCTDPRLTNAAAETFDATLTTASPAIDSGLQVGGLVPAIDIAGTTRPTGAGVDRGAYER